MKRSTRGCGCAIAVVLLIGLAAGAVAWKFDLVKWWRAQRVPKPTGELQVHVLDVGPGEGDSILIISPTGKSVLIDAGDAGKGKVILEALKRIRAGVYGTCLVCQSPIAFDRLWVIPETKTCVRCS